MYKGKIKVPVPSFPAPTAVVGRVIQNRRHYLDYLLEVLRLLWGDPRYRIPRLLIVFGLPLVAAPWWQPLLYEIVSRWLGTDRELLSVSEWATFGSGWALILLGVGLYI